MKIYRCVIGGLLVFFIAIGVWYVVSCLDEQRSYDKGILIWEQNRENDCVGQQMRGVEKDVTDHSIC